MSPFVFDLQRFAEGERTEPASPRRREEARKQGQVAKSQEVGLALVLLAGALGLRVVGPMVGRSLTVLMQRFLGGEHWQAELTPQALRAMVLEAALGVGGGVALLALLVATAGALAQLVQVGFLVSARPLRPQLSRINPAEGVKRLVSKRALVEMLKALLKAAIVGWVGYRTVIGAVGRAERLVAAPPVEGAMAVADLALQAVLTMGLALLVLAVFDYAFQRLEFEQSLRMSRRELQEEIKEQEGDPQIRSRIRQRQRQIARQRMMQQVPKATVVITNPTHVAVALRYEVQTMEAPVVVAKGQEALAQRIREVAQAHGVPIVSNPPLARTLFETAGVGDPIPAELYQAVAEVLAFVYRMKRPHGR